MNSSLKIGLKGATNPSQVSNRLAQKNVDIYEIHLNEDDLFGQKYIELDTLIATIQSKGIKVYLHHPMKIQGTFLHVNAEDSILEDYFRLSTRILVDLCEKHDIYVVVHWNYSSEDDSVLAEPVYADKESYIHTMHKVLSFDKQYGKGRILWENGVIGIGAYRDDFILADLIKGTSLKLCFDISHAFISLHGDNEALVKTIACLKNHIDYFHVVDSMGVKHDSLSIGEGNIDFKKIKPFILRKDYIYEIGLKDINDCHEMIESHDTFSSL